MFGRVLRMPDGKGIMNYPDLSSRFRIRSNCSGYPNMVADVQQLPNLLLRPEFNRAYTFLVWLQYACPGGHRIFCNTWGSY